MPALNRFLGSDPAMMTGMVRVLVGGGSVGVSLTVAGEGAAPSATALGAVAAIALTCGLALLVAAFRRCGALLWTPLSDAERAAYGGKTGLGCRSTVRVPRAVAMSDGCRLPNGVRR